MGHNISVKRDTHREEQTMTTTKYNLTVDQFRDMLVASLANLHNITVTEVPSEVPGMHMFSVVSDPVEYIRFVSYDSYDSQTAVEFNCRELTDCVFDAYEWAREVMW